VWLRLSRSCRNTWTEKHRHLAPHTGELAALRQLGVGHASLCKLKARLEQEIRIRSICWEARRTRVALEFSHTPPRWRPAGDNAMERRIFVSVRTDRGLDQRRRQVKAAIINKIRDAGYAPQEFFEMGIASDLPWTFDNVEKVMRQCIGAIIICFPRWTIHSNGNAINLVGEYQHYEGAVAVTLGLPMMIIAEDGVENRGIAWQGGRGAITHLPGVAVSDWVDSSEFTRKFAAWRKALTARRDVFLGYCRESIGIAAQIQVRLVRHGATVCNWEMDFRSGASILDELDAARRDCSCGIFLFSEDDPLEGRDGGAAPRDNVVFEAGHFISSKGPTRCLIIRQGDAKIPADLGGAIYVTLDKTGSVEAIDGRLAQFLEVNL
jgi:Predicted nucleotide-binding protein containing TIR-like domain